MKIRNVCTKKVLTATMNTIIGVAAVLGLAIATVGFHFYRKLELPRGIDDMDQMVINALVTAVFGLVISIITVGGAYWLNNGPSHFKIVFCGPIVVIAYAMIVIRGSLPNVEKTMNDAMLAEYSKYYRNRMARGIVDECQRKHECCGYFGVEDFPEHQQLPDSCCTWSNMRKYGYCSRRAAYIDPCRFKLGEIIDLYFNSMDIVCYVTSSILFALVFVVQVVVFFAKEGKKEKPKKII